MVAPSIWKCLHTRTHLGRYMSVALHFIPSNRFQFVVINTTLSEETRKKYQKLFLLPTISKKSAHNSNQFLKVWDLLNGKFGRFHERQTLILFKRFISSLSFFDSSTSFEWTIFYLSLSLSPSSCCYQLKKLVGEIDACWKQREQLAIFHTFSHTDIWSLCEAFPVLWK